MGFTLKENPFLLSVVSSSTFWLHPSFKKICGFKRLNLSWFRHEIQYDMFLQVVAFHTTLVVVLLCNSLLSDALCTTTFRG